MWCTDCTRCPWTGDRSQGRRFWSSSSLAAAATGALTLAEDALSRPLNARLDEDLRSFDTATVWLGPAKEVGDRSFLR